ncbi:hypothetical protein Bpfe_007798, partial [Biomphalaria pfeifferi]
MDREADHTTFTARRAPTPGSTCYKWLKAAVISLRVPHRNIHTERVRVKAVQSSLAQQ